MQRARLIAAIVTGGLLLVTISAFVTWRIATLRLTAERRDSPEAQPASDRTSVYPPQLRGRKSLELGELILLLMPDAATQTIGWDYRVDSPIVWQTSGYQEGPKLSQRVGYVRVNIQGRTATVLRQRVEELGWSVIYSTDEPAKFGPREIEIEPGGQSGDDICFGTNFDGCDFDEPSASLTSAGIQVKALCAKGMPSGRISVSLLTHPQRRPTIVVWETSGGSGGSSASLTLKLNDQPDSNLCEKYSESPSP